MITEETTQGLDYALLDNIAYRAFAQCQVMIHEANHRPDKESGDPKVGGHPASCASSLHVLSALHLVVRAPFDYVCCKPHASPIDHSLHHLAGFFRDSDTGEWFDVERAKAVMHRLRKFPQPGAEDVFQSYHARTDPDSFNFLPSGSVGIPPVVSVYLALAYRYARDHNMEVPEGAHFWSLIGDSEFREGSLLEAMPDAAERHLGNVTWIVDYNRQNLDGTRIPNEKGLESTDCDRIEETAIANGWKVIHLRHGGFREELFTRRGGDELRDVFEHHLSDYELQMLALKHDSQVVRDMFIQKDGGCRAILESLDDEEVMRALLDVGGHDMQRCVEALAASRNESDEPYMLIAHTFKGWGLECLADPANHSTLPGTREVEEIMARAGLTSDDPFALFPAQSEEGHYLEQRKKLLRAGRDEQAALRERNRSRLRESIVAAGGVPDSLEIDLSLFPIAHTQWMWGQLAAKLVRIGTQDLEEQRSGVPGRALTENEERWRAAAKYVLTLSPDVGSSTNISPAMDSRVYGPIAAPDPTLPEKLDVQYKHPELLSTQDAWTRHIRFEIAEANCMSAVGSFGKMAHYVGLPFFPIMTVYDFFIKRALDQLYYNLYWSGEFVIMGTPSGVTLSPEGAQHSWKSDIQIPNLITWEPLFAREVDWILCDAIRRTMMDENEGRRGVLIRGVTRGIRQTAMLDHIRLQAQSKTSVQGPLKPQGAGAEWGTDAVDESTLPAMAEDALLARTRELCLAGAYYLVDWRGYAGYEPGDNVVHVFSMGSPTTEAVEASHLLLARGVFANVIVVSSPELLLGILGEKSGYEHLKQGLDVTGDLFAVEDAGANEAGLLSIAGRRVPIVAVCDGEAGLLDNIGSVVGVKQKTLAVRKFSKCGRPTEVYRYQHLDRDSIADACGEVLAETALEDLRVSPALLEKIAGRTPARGPGDWRELWPDRPSG